MTLRKKNILFVVPSLKRAGAERQAVDLVNGLNKNIFTAHLFTFGPELDLKDQLKGNGVVFYHHLRNRKIDFAVIARMAAIIDDNDIDCIHCTIQFSFLLAWLALKKASKTVPLIAAIHTTKNVGLKQELQDWLVYQWILRQAAMVVFVCKAQQHYWQKRYPFLLKKSEVIYNGIDSNFFTPTGRGASAVKLRQQFGITDKDFVISCIAGFRREKGHHLLIDALTEINHRGIHLLLAGDGPTLPEIQTIIKKRQLHNQVHFLGIQQDVRPVLQASDISVLASTAVETFSIAMLESMAMEIPVVAADIGGLREAIAPGRNGELFTVGNHYELAAAITKLMDSKLLTKMKHNARETVIEHFTINKMVQDTEYLFLRLS